MKCKAATGLFAAVRWAAIASALAWGGHAAAAPDQPQPFAAVREVVQWVAESGDHQRKPFAIVDKRQARLYVFDGDGRFAGASVALLGATIGDHTVPGVGERAQRGEVRDDERTTPAGRFDSVPGTNLSGEHVVWADYASAFAIHRLRPGRAHAARKQRLETPTPDDNRVSLGCVIVPVAFYEQVVQRVLGASPGVVYVLPESGSLAAMLASQ
jgi:hypothetical protein